MALNKITIKGARVHNLKNIDVTVPRDKFVVFTGLSGSGKSSLAFVFSQAGASALTVVSAASVFSVFAASV